MRFRILLSISPFIMLIAFPAAHAQLGGKADGNALYSECSTLTNARPGHTLSDIDVSDITACVGLVRGVMDTLLIWDAADSKRAFTGIHGCIPAEVSFNEAAKVVIKYLNDHPEKLHMADTVLIRTALVEAYPCKT